MSQVFIQKPVIVGPLLQMVSKLNYRGVDMHFHTEYSMDGISKIKLLLEECRKRGIGVAITDHNEIKGVIKAMEQNTGQFIIPGIEITCNTGVHLVLYFPEASVLEEFYLKEVQPLKRKNPFFLPLSIDKMLKIARKYDSYTCVPHPYGPGVIGIMKEGKVTPGMLERIDMDVIHVRTKIRLIANQVFPITALPKPRSLRAMRTRERRSVFGNALENAILINRHRVAKSASSGGSSITQCRCSGNTTQP